MYTPGPFLISAAALTSIFSFFFGRYFSEREWAYRLWILIQAYDAELGSDEKQKAVCAELESKERFFRQAKGLLLLLLFTLLVEFIVFQFYSLQYIDRSSPSYEPDAFHTYLSFNTIIAFILLINCIELVYIQVALERTSRFPFFRFRKRVTGQDRLYMLWCAFHCHDRKKSDVKDKKIPKSFYRALERDKADN